MPLEIKGLINPINTSVPTTHLAEIHDGGLEPTDSFTVTKNLTHAVIRNEQITNTSYYANVEPEEGWSGLTVTIKVGGVDMSNLYQSGTISIPNVTGNIVITAVAAQAPLSSITATYTQSGTVYDTDSLDSLKSDLVVTANYEDSSTATIASTDYTLSGTLAEGTSTITVSYGGKTATFSVVVSPVSIPFEIGTILNGVETTNTARVRSDYVKIGDEYTIQNGDVTSDIVSEEIILSAISGLDISTGAIITNNARAITQFIPVTAGASIGVACNGWCYLKIFEYTSSKGFLSSATLGNLNTNSAGGTLNSSCNYIRVLFKKSDGTDFTVNELESLSVVLKSLRVAYKVNATANGSTLQYSPGVFYGFEKNYIGTIGVNTSTYDGYSGSSGWLDGDGSEYFAKSIDSATVYIRILGKVTDGSDISSLSGSIEINGKEFNVTLE